MAMYRLHGFCQSGNTFKVAFLLRALRQPWEAVFVDYLNGTTRDASWREQANEMGEAPVLDDGPRRMTQSGAIMTYLARKHGEFGGRNEDEQQEVLRWLLFDNHKFTSYFASYRFMKAFGATAPDPTIMAWLKGRIDGAFGIAEKHLAARPFMVGDAPTIADISMCAYLCYPKEESGYDLPAQFPNLAAWLARVQSIEGYAPPYDVLPGERISPKW
ncbi:MAG: Glutathione S-transferase [Ramlibacter sp.]|nr:Glutathione S-transferase [Ramlibacter sp.]